MTAPIQYKFYVDTNYDGTFSSAYDDVTDYLIQQVQWNNGMADSYDEVAQPARLSCTLSNRTGVFNREPIGGELVANSSFDSWSGGYPVGWTVTDNVGASSFIQQVGTGVIAPGTGTGSCGVSDATAEVTLSQNVLTIGHAYIMNVVVSASDSTIGVKATTYAAAGKVMNGSRLVGYLSAVNIPTRTFTRTHEIIYGAPAPAAFSFIFIATDPKFTIQATGSGWKQTFDSVSVVEVPLYKIVKRDMLVKLDAIYNGTTYTRFIGRISDMTFNVGLNLEPTVSLTAEDAMLQLLDAEYTPPLMIGATVDEAITRMFDDGFVRWPYSRNFWLMGVPGSSEVGINTYLYQNTSSNLDTGVTELSYLGDAADRGQGVSAQGYLRDLVAAEAGGRFYWNARTAQFVFKNRYTDPLNITIDDTYTHTDFDNVRFVYGSEVANQLTVNFTARTVGSAGSVIWTDSSVPYPLRNVATRKINARYFDSTNETLKIGATDGIQPVAGLDFTANTSSDGGGTDVSAFINVNADFGATSAKILLSNATGQDVFITFLRLRGTPLTQSTDMVDSLSGDSIRSNELHSKTIDLKLLDDRDLAQNYADYQVAKFKDPIARLQSVQFNSLLSSKMAEAALVRDINDQITVTINSINHSEDYFIVGEQHTVLPNGDKPCMTTWILKPAGRETTWILNTTGYSELGTTTFLGF